MCVWRGSQTGRSLEDGVGSGVCVCWGRGKLRGERDERGKRRAREGKRSGRDESRQRIGLACLPLGPLHCTPSLDMRPVCLIQALIIRSIDYLFFTFNNYQKFTLDSLPPPLLHVLNSSRFTLTVTLSRVAKIWPVCLLRNFRKSVIDGRLSQPICRAHLSIPLIYIRVRDYRPRVFGRPQRTGPKQLSAAVWPGPYSSVSEIEQGERKVECGVCGPLTKSARKPPAAAITRTSVLHA